MSLLAVVLAALAGALVVGGRPTPASRSHRARLSPILTAAGAGVAATVLALRVDGTALVLGLILLGAGLGASRLASTAHRRRAAVRREERVLELCEALAGELRAGQPPAQALGECVHLWPEFAPVAAAARLGADVPTAMRQLGTHPGAQGLISLAGAWQVSESSGAALASSLTRVVETARASQATRRIVASELASTQATARLVALLPVMALLMGAGAGGDPWRFLLASPVGLACLTGGLVLIFVGLLWIESLATAAMR